MVVAAVHVLPVVAASFHGHPDEARREMVVMVVAVRVSLMVRCLVVVECPPHRCLRLVEGVVHVSPESLFRHSQRRLPPNVPECRSRRRCLSSPWRASECDCLQVLLQWASVEGESETVSLIRRTE